MTDEKIPKTRFVIAAFAGAFFFLGSSIMMMCVCDIDDCSKAFVGAIIMLVSCYIFYMVSRVEDAVDELAEVIKPESDNTKPPKTIDTIRSNLWVLMGVVGGIGGFIINGSVDLVIYGIAMGLSMGYIFFKEK